MAVVAHPVTPAYLRVRRRWELFRKGALLSENRRRMGCHQEFQDGQEGRIHRYMRRTTHMYTLRRNEGTERYYLHIMFPSWNAT